MFNLTSSSENKSERSLRGACGTPSGEASGIGPMAASCSAVSEESFLFYFCVEG